MAGNVSGPNASILLFSHPEQSVIVWDLETVPGLGGFAAANDLVGKLDVEVREAIGEKFPKHPCLQSSKFEFIINAQHARPRSAADAARPSRRAEPLA